MHRNRTFKEHLLFTAYFTALCFYYPYREALIYYSGYGIAMNPDNPPRVRAKGRLMFAMLFWFPFVMGFIGGCLILGYTLFENTVLLALYLKEVLPKFSALFLKRTREFMARAAQVVLDYSGALWDLCEDFGAGVKQIAFEIGLMFRAKKAQDTHETKSEQNPWERAIIMNGICETLKRSWNNSYDASVALHKKQDRIYQHELRQRKKERGNSR